MIRYRHSPKSALWTTLQSQVPDPFCSPVPISQHVPILKAIGAVEQKGSGLRDQTQTNSGNTQVRLGNLDYPGTTVVNKPVHTPSCVAERTCRSCCSAEQGVGMRLTQFVLTIIHTVTKILSIGTNNAHSHSRLLVNKGTMYTRTSPPSLLLFSLFFLADIFIFNFQFYKMQGWCKCVVVLFPSCLAGF